MTETTPKIIRTPEEQKIAMQMHDSFRDELLKRDLSNTESYDKALMTLSAASLGISLTTIRFIVPLETASYICLIQLGWLLLLISIIVSIIAFQLSNRAIKNQLKNAEDYYLKCNPQAFHRKNIAQKINSFLNFATGILFIVAITSIVSFVILNIEIEAEKMAKKPSSIQNARMVNDSANVPTMQQVPNQAATSSNSANIPTMQQAPETQTTSQTSTPKPASDSSKSE